MSLLSISSVSKSFGENTLFNNISFAVEPKEKIGFIGSNGTGKTTMFKILNGSEAPDTGNVTRSQSLKIGYMEQHALKDSSKTLYDEVITAFDYLRDIEKRHTEVTDKIALGLDMSEYITLQHELSQQFEDLGGLTYESRTSSMLRGLGFSEEDFLLPVSSLSGGERTRASLAKHLLSDCNLLLLDEPTNHLDMSAIAFLEDYLKSYGGALIIISHDRYFLDRVTHKTMELENKRLTVFNGNYTSYSLFKEKNTDVMQKHYENEMREIHRIEGIIKQQRQWNREKNIKTAESKQKMLDKMTANLEKPEIFNERVRINFKAGRQSGGDVLNVANLSKSFDRTELFKNVSMDVKRGERAFILGDNGTGKTTILNILSGKTKKDSGEIRFGTNVDMGYYDQHSANLTDSNTIIEEIRNDYPLVTDTEIRNMLAGFLFFGDDVFKEISCLSGGERARVALLKLIMSRPNLLFLDEPTNHLDIASREALESALAGYDGTAVIVSHDRYFINKLATKIYALKKDGADVFSGNYDYYMEKSKTETHESAAPKQKNNDYKREKQEKAARQKAERQLKKAEEAIENTEAELEKLNEELQNSGSDYVAAARLSQNIEELTSKLDELYSEWEELSSMQE